MVLITTGCPRPTVINHCNFHSLQGHWDIPDIPDVSPGSGASQTPENLDQLRRDPQGFADYLEGKFHESKAAAMSVEFCYDSFSFFIKIHQILDPVQIVLDTCPPFCILPTIRGPVGWSVERNVLAIVECRHVFLESRGVDQLPLAI
ncbi:uncharacterized protein LY89DRAFT_728120 [Mollisia scopiformis]|uniref:Uncharacterized protein n=1 Tax=Mollisia scopiformis TaxID=149040 RepID=A0A194XUI3_MOLSC|nr:uncharacterized protein LY89DRAFT_728120 [Mollisia scopiformis]KUJ23367.1 hypothetical protein LY89DRAFT_728120 [Mollisia scopiformis]